jgi:hypothetical protein
MGPARPSADSASKPPSTLTPNPDPRRTDALQSHGACDAQRAQRLAAALHGDQRVVPPRSGRHIVEGGLIQGQVLRGGTVVVVVVVGRGSVIRDQGGSRAREVGLGYVGRAS